MRDVARFMIAGTCIAVIVGAGATKLALNPPYWTIAVAAVLIVVVAWRLFAYQPPAPRKYPDAPERGIYMTPEGLANLYHNGVISEEEYLEAKARMEDYFASRGLYRDK